MLYAISVFMHVNKGVNMTPRILAIVDCFLLRKCGVFSMLYTVGEFMHVYKDVTATPLILAIVDSLLLGEGGKA